MFSTKYNTKSKICKVHLIGIGGIGVSALAQYFLALGHKVSGSDLVRSEMTDLLEEKGAKIWVGPHRKSNIKYFTLPSFSEEKFGRARKSKIFTRLNFAPQNLGGRVKNQKYILPDLVIYSPAVRPDNPELKEAKRLKIKCQSYPEALGELTKKYFTIAISGTHGKSTTTAMVALILIKAGLDPTVIIGTKLKEFGNSNFRGGGESKTNVARTFLPWRNVLVIEADEYAASFLNYWPKIIVITNIDKDHLDYYKNLKNILRAFKKFIGHLPKEGWLIANGEDRNTRKIISNFQGARRSGRVEGGWRPISNQFSIINYQLSKSNDSKKLRRILKVPGEHNVSNALAALAVARILKISDKVSFKALSEFKGTWRRFEEYEVMINDQLSVIIISDYAHHPTEILATLKAAREKYPNRRIWCIFQPHQYQRTHYLFGDFVKVFSEALTMKALRGPSLAPLIDKLILTEIYDVTGREEKKISRKVSSKLLAEKILNATRKDVVAFINDMRKIPIYLRKHIKNNDVVIIMGAGDIYKLVKQFVDVSCERRGREETGNEAATQLLELRREF